MPWDDARLDAVEAEARACTSGDACTVDVLALVAEVRRLRSALRHRLVVRCVETTCPECRVIASLLDLTDDEFVEAAASQPS